MEFKRAESIILVVHTESLETLLLKRVPPRVFWQSVTGSMKWDESSPVLAAVRELREETGIEVQPSSVRDWKRTFKFEILPEYRHRYLPNVIYNTEHMFSIRLGEPCDVRLDPAEHEDCRWESIDTAIQTVWSWSNRRALQIVLEDERR